MDKAQDFLVNNVTRDEVELLKLELVMTTDKEGHSTPMACGIVVVKCIQGRACSKLVRVLYDSGGSKFTIKENILPKEVRLDTDHPRTLMKYLSRDVCSPRISIYQRNATSRL